MILYCRIEMGVLLCAPVIENWHDICSQRSAEGLLAGTSPQAGRIKLLTRVLGKCFELVGIFETQVSCESLAQVVQQFSVRNNKSDPRWIGSFRRLFCHAEVVMAILHRSCVRVFFDGATRRGLSCRRVFLLRRFGGLLRIGIGRLWRRLGPTSARRICHVGHFLSHYADVSGGLCCLRRRPRKLRRESGARKGDNLLSSVRRASRLQKSGCTQLKSK